MRRAMRLAALAVCFVSSAAVRCGAENPETLPRPGQKAGAPKVTVATPKGPARTLAAAILAAREQGAERGPVSDRVFRIKCVVIERDVDGKEQVLSRPQVMTLAGQPAQVQIGAATPLVTGVEKGADGAAKPMVSLLESGIKLSMKIEPEQGGRAAFDLTIERAEIESVEVTKAADGTSRQSVRVGTKTARVLESIELGKTVTVGLDNKDPAKSKVRVELVVEEVRAGDVNR